jgi:tRNA (guanine37-N1)-methyltransferase
MFNVSILTIFPDLFPGPLGISVLGRALQQNLWTLDVKDIRDFATDRHKSVDDSPTGGGAGMVFKPDVLARAIEAAQKDLSKPAKVIYLSPRGKLFSQKLAKEILSSKNIILICGRFEGVDQRVLDHYEVEELSIGNYVLSGGETAAFAVVDTCVRLIPGVLGKELSAQEESFGLGTDYENLVEYDQYTKPAEWQGLKIPEVLLSGNHEKIKAWRFANAKERTKRQRSDL